MIDARCIQLLGRKLSGEATEEELAELGQLLLRHPEAAYYAELITHLWEEEQARRSPSGDDPLLDAVYRKHLEKHNPEFQPQAMPLRPASERAGIYGMEDGDTGQGGHRIGGQYGRAWRKPARIMASLILLAAAGGLFWLVTGRSAHRRDYSKTDSNKEFVTGEGDRQTILLPDGTKVRLNSGSRLIYDSDMLRKDERTVTLSGEAYFDVAKDKDHCFLIHTDKLVIRVLGTVFNVKAYPHDQTTEATLIGGSIELTVNSKPYQKFLLKPKEKFALTEAPAEPNHGNNGRAGPNSATGQGNGPDSARQGNPYYPRYRQDPNAKTALKEKLVIQDIQAVEVDDKEYVREVSWVDDKLVFQNETLEELAHEMERWFNVSIEIRNGPIRIYHFTGVFHKETIDQALSALQLIKPFTFKITNRHVLIN
jgi:transmembrane sensor